MLPIQSNKNEYSQEIKVGKMSIAGDKSTEKKSTKKNNEVFEKKMKKRQSLSTEIEIQKSPCVAIRFELNELLRELENSDPTKCIFCGTPKNNFQMKTELVASKTKEKKVNEAVSLIEEDDVKIKKKIVRNKTKKNTTISFDKNITLVDTDKEIELGKLSPLYKLKRLQTTNENIENTKVQSDTNAFKSETILQKSNSVPTKKTEVEKVNKNMKNKKYKNSTDLELMKNVKIEDSGITQEISREERVKTTLKQKGPQDKKKIN